MTRGFTRPALAMLGAAGLAFAGYIALANAAEELPRADAARLERRIHELGRFGANPEGGVSRVAFSAADIAGREYVKSLMRGAGLDVRVDAAGNVIGRRAGTDPVLPVIMTGSHIDSVPKGGNYDGDVGVLGAIEVAELLQAKGIATRHPFEFVVFTDEEGGTVGSQAMAGRLGASASDLGRWPLSSNCTSSKARSSTSPASTSASSRESWASAGGTSMSRELRTTRAPRR
jgi:hypothetical protein